MNFSTKILGVPSRNGSSVVEWQQWCSITRYIFALEAHQDEHPAFNRGAVGSIPIGRTRRFFHEDVGKRSSRQTFNLENAGSNPAVLTMRPVGPMDHDASLRNSRFRFESGAGCQVFGRVFQRPGWGTVYASTGVRLPSRPPSSAVAT